MRIKVTYLIVGFFAVAVLLVTEARAEFYVAGQAGYTMPDDLSDIQSTGTLSGISISDLDLKESVMYGAKLGYFFPTLKWLGIEAEAFNTTPHIKQQTVTASGLGVTASTLASGAHFRVLTTAFNLIARYPGKTLQPYAGVGVGIFFAKISDEGGSNSDNGAPGLNALAGIRWLITQHLGVFAEYKYTQATFKFDNIAGTGTGLEADYSAGHIAGGVSIHF
jgi:opacity protein-like surface antigen